MGTSVLEMALCGRLWWWTVVVDTGRDRDRNIKTNRKRIKQVFVTVA